MIPFEPVSAVCTLCGGDIYGGETYYAVGGECVCGDCLKDYAARVLAPWAVKGGRPWQKAARGSAT